MLCEMDELEKFDFSKHADALRKYIKEHWNVSARPKGYAEFTKDYKDYQGQEELDEKAILEAFDGCNDTGACSFSFPMRLSLPHTAYDDICQGRKPFETLVGAIFGYGIAYGMRMEEVGDNTSTYYRLSSIRHCISMMEHNRHPEKKELYRQELEDHFKVKIDHMITSDKYRRLRSEVDKRNVIPMIRKMLKSTKSRMFILVQNKFKNQKPVFDILLDLCVGRISKENPVFVDLRRELKQFGIILKMKSKRGTHPMVFTFKRARKKKHE